MRRAPWFIAWGEDDALSDQLARPARAWPFLIAGAVAALLVFAAIMAFVVVPVSQARSLGISPWAAICRAVGLTHQPAAYANSTGAEGQMPVSSVVYDPDLLDRLSHANIQAGAQLATQTCSACHGDQGVSQNPQFPLLADQSAAAIYKELRDYKAGARVSPFMAPIVQTLTDRQMVDVATYFARDHAFGGLGPRWPVPDAATINLVRSGDPARDLPACDSCHGANAGGPIESPSLYGQKQGYLQAQLQAFASGARRNDVYGRMRSVAGKLTSAEQARLAEYYQGLN